MNFRFGIWRAQFAQMLQLSAGPATPVTVEWTLMAGAGSMDPTSGASDGVPVQLSGVMNCLAHVVEASLVQRTFREIQAGDLIVDMDPNSMVSIFDGQGYMSGTIALDEIATAGTRFIHDGRKYAQAKVGEELALIWGTTAGGQAMHRTIVLRPSV